MHYYYSIIMFCLAGGILLYAAIVKIGGYGFIPRTYTIRPKNPSDYAKQFAKTLALTAAAPAISGVLGLFGEFMLIPALIALGVGFVVFIYIGHRKFMKPHNY